MENEVDAGLLEAIEALTGDQIAALQADTAEAAQHLREMASCVERFTHAESAKFVALAA